MKLTKQQIIDAAVKANFHSNDDGWFTENADAENSEFHAAIGFEEYALGDNIIEMLKNLGIEVAE